jgi:hypothetical protein
MRNSGAGCSANRRSEIAYIKKVTNGVAPGYRDLCIDAVDTEGSMHEIRFTASAVQDLIYAVADAARQGTGARAPIDWKEFSRPSCWPPMDHR